MLREQTISDKPITVQKDHTNYIRAEAVNKEQATLFDKAKDAIVIQDLGDRILYWNQAAESLYGFTAIEAVGKFTKDLFYRDECNKPIEVDQALRENGEWHGELEQLTKDDIKVAVDSRNTLVRDERGKPKSILMINTDKTERKRLVAQFLRAQRMESIGSLAGGIAHDLNNLLAPITLSADILLKNPVDERSKELLSMITSSSKRAGSVVNQLLTFARGVQVGENVLIQPKHVLIDIVKFIKETFPANINIRFSIPNELWLLNGDPTQLQQVFLNLCINARDAMPRGGNLFLGAENVFFDKTYAVMSSEAKPGSYVVLTVTDTGEGMSNETREKIFTPFFTTKKIGEGTGLGLSTSLGIVQSHGGFFIVDSRIGHGSTFKVYFPANTTGSEQVHKFSVKPLPPANGERVLIVDDKSNIRIATQEVLEAQGYKVLTAGDGTDALALFVKSKNKIRVVLTDIGMPYMDGVALVRTLKKIKPDTKVIVSTGQGEKNLISELEKLGVKIFLHKPYSAETLIRALNKVLMADAI